jgi:16S rRNA U516 pseudouridylate synthase RsuA-like enzyme
MFAAAGSRVARLRRTTYAGITLAGLDRGAWRRLVDAEAEALYGRVSLSPADSVEAWIEPGATASPC